MKRTIVLLVVFAAVAASASQIIAHTLSDRVRVSERVALVQVIDQRVVTEGDDPHRLLTYTDVVVGEDYKGSGADRFTIAQVGGTLGTWSLSVPGDAKFKVGETAIVFVKCFRSTGRCGLVALQEAKLDVDADKVRVHDLFNDTWSVRALKQVADELRAAAKEQK